MSIFQKCKDMLDKCAGISTRTAKVECYTEVTNCLYSANAAYGFGTCIDENRSNVELCMKEGSERSNEFSRLNRVVSDAHLDAYLERSSHGKFSSANFIGNGVKISGNADLKNVKFDDKSVTVRGETHLENAEITEVGGVFKMSQEHSFYCSHSIITAKDIYLPPKSMCTIAPDCHLIGNVVYAAEINGDAEL